MLQQSAAMGLMLLLTSVCAAVAPRKGAELATSSPAFKAARLGSLRELLVAVPPYSNSSATAADKAPPTGATTPSVDQADL